MRKEILELLRQAGNKYISGEEIASRLGVSRTAVWKHIRELRASGYEIVSQSRSGYSLKEAPDRLLASEIKHNLNTKCIGSNFVCHECAASTNNEAKTLALNGVAEGTVVVAERQNGGKGRLDRKFFSPPGKGIWFSVILRPPFLPQEAPKCTLLAAVAVARAMQEFNLQAHIKWPNDIMFDNKKLVGILTEMNAEMERINYIVMGIGINVNIMPEDFPDDIRDKATSLAIMKGEKLPRVKFFQAVLRALDNLYLEVLSNGFSVVMQEWRKYSITLGQKVRVIGARDGEVFLGTAYDIDAEGALLVETKTGCRRVLAGDVSIRPQ